MIINKLKLIYRMSNSWVARNIIAVLLVTLMPVYFSFISDFLTWFFTKVRNFMYQGDYGSKPISAEALNALLTFVLTIVALLLSWKAYTSSQKANELSKMALEVERPVLKFRFDDISKLLYISNSENVDAINTYVFNIVYSSQFNLEPNGENLNISASIQEYEMKLNDLGVSLPCYLIFYQNPITNKIYFNAFEIKFTSNKIKQLSELSYLKYSEYKRIYQKFNSYNDIQLLIKDLTS